MAKLSRNQRHKARTRKNLSLYKREYAKLLQQHQNAFYMLIAIAQLRGPITITAEDRKAVSENFRNKTYQTEPQENGDLVFSLIDKTPAAEPVDSVSIKVIEDAPVDEPMAAPVDAEA